jgi:predicted MFS family arabinose efflux permease
MAEAQSVSFTASVPQISAGRTVRVSRTVGFVAMSAALLAFFVAAGAPTPLLPLYEREWSFAPTLLTVAFGVYAFALIAALLVFGSLSDYIGRRPVLIGALGLELVSMVVFLFSPSISWLIVGRVLQGLATGVASSTFGAAIVELAPESRKRLGAVMSSLATTAGLAVGALLAGLIAFAIPAAASTTVWLALVVVMAVGTLFAVLTPETSAPRAGALTSLIPTVSVPPRVRRLFAATAPTIVAAFLDTALFLGLIPIILVSVFHVTTPMVGGAVNFVMFAAATISAGVTGGMPARRLRMFGNLGITIGIVLLLGGLASGAIALVWASAALAGLGMGASFTGSIRGLVPEVEPHQRAGLFSAIFVLAYLTFGGSAIAAGFVATAIGVGAMAVGFAVTIVIVALIGLVLSIGRTGRR